MKKIIVKSSVFLTLIASLNSCKKEDGTITSSTSLMTLAQLQILGLEDNTSQVIFKIDTTIQTDGTVSIPSNFIQFTADSAIYYNSQSTESNPIRIVNGSLKFEVVNANSGVFKIGGVTNTVIERNGNTIKIKSSENPNGYSVLSKTNFVFN